MSVETTWHLFLSAVLAPAAAYFVGWIVRLNREWRRRWQEWRRKPPHDDATFLRDCGVAPTGPGAHLALTARRILGDLRGAPPETFHADDSFADPFWDSLDWVEVVIRIEMSIDAKLPGTILDATAARAGGDLPKARIRDFVAALAESTPQPLRRPGRARPARVPAGPASADRLSS